MISSFAALFAIIYFFVSFKYGKNKKMLMNLKENIDVILLVLLAVHQKWHFGLWLQY